MRPLLAALLLTALAFAGCSGDPEGDDGVEASGTATATGTATGAASTSGSRSASSTGSASQTGTTAPANRAPAAGLAVTVNGTGALFQVTASDPDGDALSWSLSFGDGAANATGAAVPANLTHNYTAAGTFNATLVVSDGALQGTANVTVVAMAAGGASVFTFTASTSLTGSPASSGLILGGTPGLGALACAGFHAGESGRDCVFSAVPAVAIGGVFTITSTVTAPDYEFWDACKATGKAVQAFGGELTGTVPAGTGCVVMWNYGSATGSFTIDVVK